MFISSEVSPPQKLAAGIGLHGLATAKSMVAQSRLHRRVADRGPQQLPSCCGRWQDDCELWCFISSDMATWGWPVPSKLCSAAGPLLVPQSDKHQHE